MPGMDHKGIPTFNRFEHVTAWANRARETIATLCNDMIGLARVRSGQRTIRLAALHRFSTKFSSIGQAM